MATGARRMMDQVHQSVPARVAAKPLTVAIVGLQPFLSARWRALLLSVDSPLLVSDVSLADALEGVANDVAVVILATGTETVDRDRRLSQLFQAPPCPPVLVVSDTDDDRTAIGMLRRGAAGYVLSCTTAEELVAVVRRVASGQVVMDPFIGGRIAGRLAGGAQWRDPRLDAWDLHPRERQILELLCGGRTNQEIARSLNLGEATIKTYLRSLYRKLEVRDRSQAIGVALRGDDGAARQAYEAR